MTSTALVFISLIIGSLAVPPAQLAYGARQERLVTGQIINAIENLAQNIRDAGMDPFEMTDSLSYQLPVPVILDATAFVDALTITGLSNIVVNSMNFSILANRLTFNISLPRILAVINNSGFDVTFFGEEYSGTASGSVAIVQPRVVGDIRISIGVISGISIRSLDLIFSLGGIEPNLTLNILGNNISQEVNTYLGTTLPAKIAAHSAEINELIETIAWEVINEHL